MFTVLLPQLTISLQKEDSDPTKRLHHEYCFAGGLIEYVKWLNADKVSIRISGCCVSVGVSLFCDSLFWFQKPLHDVLAFSKQVDGVTIDAALQW